MGPRIAGLLNTLAAPRDQEAQARVIDLLKAATPYEGRFTGVPYLRGLAYLQSGSAADAVKEFEKVLNRSAVTVQ